MTGTFTPKWVAPLAPKYPAPVLNLKLNQTKDNITTSYSYYLNDAQFQSIDKLQDIPLNDWFKIYMVSEMENVPITTDQFKTFSNIISNGYIRENWTDLNERIKDFTNEIVINQPTLIESYSLASNTNSFVLLMPVRSAHDERTILMIMNNILVNNRMLFVAYYLNYEGPNSVKLANQRNDYFIYRFLEENTRQ
jgi:hypothetical protein